MATAINRREVVIVGSGILGLTTAACFEQQGRECTVFCGREVLGEIPPRDSQRNHKWKQSGLLYVETSTALANRVFLAGNELMDFFGLPEPSGKGVFGFSTKKHADRFMRAVSDARLEHLVDRIEGPDAAHLLSHCFSESSTYIEVPDVPFDEAQIARNARSLTRQSELIPGDVRLSWTKLNGATCIAVHEGENSFVADITVVCAGDGIPNLLDSLNVPHSFQVSRSVLLRVYDRHDTHSCVSAIKTPLFADRTRGREISIIRSRREDYPLTDCSIIGAGFRKRLSREEQRRREVPQAEKEQIIQLLPDRIQKPVHALSRATAGHKTEWVQSGHKVASKIMPIPGCRNAIVAVPGKATLALDAARQILDKATTLGSQKHYRDPKSSSFEPDLRHHTEFSDKDESTLA